MIYIVILVGMMNIDLYMLMYISMMHTVLSFHHSSRDSKMLTIDIVLIR